MAAKTAELNQPLTFEQYADFLLRWQYAQPEKRQRGRVRDFSDTP